MFFIKNSYKAARVANGKLLTKAEKSMIIFLIKLDKMGVNNNG